MPLLAAVTAVLPGFHPLQHFCTVTGVRGGGLSFIGWRATVGIFQKATFLVLHDPDAPFPPLSVDTV